MKHGEPSDLIPNVYCTRPHQYESVEELKDMPYEQYLQSKWWRMIIRIYKDKKCAQCSRKYELNLHHISYENLGEERPNEVITLCKRCHKDLHYYQGRANPTKNMVLKQYTINEADYESWKQNAAG